LISAISALWRFWGRVGLPGLTSCRERPSHTLAIAVRGARRLRPREKGASSRNRRGTATFPSPVAPTLRAPLEER
jgi:hypothetical protein